MIEKLNNISKDLEIFRDKHMNDANHSTIRHIQDVINDLQSIITELRYEEENYE